MAQPSCRSAAVIDRIRQNRKTRNMSVQALADGMKQHGYSTLRSALANMEGSRVRNVPVDLVYAAAAVFKIPVRELLDGPRCSTCQDTPPVGFTCNSCGSTIPSHQRRT